MTGLKTLDVNAVSLGVAAAAGGALVAYLALSFLARPPQVTARLAEAARQAAEADRVKTRLKAPAAYPPGAVCEGGADAGAGGFRQAVAAAAGQAGVTVGDVQAQPQASDEASGLQPINVSVVGSGPSAGVMKLLQTLSASTPSVFVDTLDLRPSEGAVSLKLSGRIFCSAVRP